MKHKPGSLEEAAHAVLSGKPLTESTQVEKAMSQEEGYDKEQEFEQDEKGETCIRCGVNLDSEEGLETGICADCWKPEDEDDVEESCGKLDEAKANISSGQHKWFGEYKEAEVYIWDDKTEQDIKYTIWLFPESGSGLPGGPDWSPEEAEIQKTVDENGRNFKTTPEQDKEAIDLAYDELNKYFNEEKKTNRVDEELDADEFERMTNRAALIGTLTGKLLGIPIILSNAGIYDFDEEKAQEINDYMKMEIRKAYKENQMEPPKDL